MEPIVDLDVPRARSGVQRNADAAGDTRDDARQYPIGDTANWERIVQNVAAIVDALEQTFVPEIEAAVPPAPAWFEPGR